jgi:2-polyprenyl-3-methyl-5-hydroxy-6-metoxy-1,4-benzoquinol methylase
LGSTRRRISRRDSVGSADLSEVFGPGYACTYDAVYAEKDYAAECDILEEAFNRFATLPVQTIVDFGCGTGGHSIPLAKRGYRVSGVDISSAMLNIARIKAKKARVNVSFHHGDARDVDLGQRFDAALLMFAVLGYQRTNADVAATLTNLRRHLRSRGMLVFDVWYGPGVLATTPSNRQRVIERPQGSLTRSATPELDVLHHVCKVRYVLEESLVEGGTQSTEESHVMRYFFPLELDNFLECAGFELLSMTPVGTLDRDPRVDTWNVLVVARAR